MVLFYQIKTNDLKISLLVYFVELVNIHNLSLYQQTQTFFKAKIWI